MRSQFLVYRDSYDLRSKSRCARKSGRRKRRMRYGPEIGALDAVRAEMRNELALIDRLEREQEWRRPRVKAIKRRGDKLRQPPK